MGEGLDIVLSVIGVVVSVTIAVAPIYIKVGKLEGEVRVLKDKVTELCSRINKEVDRTLDMLEKKYRNGRN